MDADPPSTTIPISGTSGPSWSSTSSIGTWSGAVSRSGSSPTSPMWTTRPSRVPWKEGVTIREYTDPFGEAFLEDAEALGIRPADLYPRATDYVRGHGGVRLGAWRRKGLAYQAEDGSVYFSIVGLPGVRAPIPDRSRGREARGPGGHGRVREGGRPGLRPLEGGQTGG